jgi:predicted MPP superfamily phosphohydrolase
LSSSANVAGHGILPELALAAVSAALNAILIGRIFRGRGRSGQFLFLWLVLSSITTISLSTAAADSLGIFVWLPAVDWFRATGFLWALIEPFLVAALWIRHSSPAANPSRRLFLKRAGAASVAAPVAAVLCGFAIAKRDARVREITLPFVDLPPDLHNMRLVQITDIHLSAFYSRSQLARAVSQANELRPHVAFVTGDLITSYGDPLDDALLELSRLSADAGVYGCLGNHEILARSEDYTTARGARFGLRFLRQNQTSLQFGSARLNLTGVDYQRKGAPYLVGADNMLRKDEFNLLLSHNPDVFPVAARQGWDLTLAGHTHGGQVTLEYLHAGLNPARFFTPFTDGVYRQGNSAVYVCRGLGTVGLPVRLGAEPEVGLIRLVRA